MTSPRVRTTDDLEPVGNYIMFNQFKKTALVAAAGLAFVATPAFAADGNPATEEGTAVVRILQPLSIDNTNGTLDFGVLVKDGAASGTNYTFSIGSAAGSVIACSASWACSGTTGPAAFTVTGAASESVQLSVDASVDLDNGGTATTFPTATLSLSDTTLVLSGAADAFQVGGTLSVDGGIGTGTYSGTFDVSAEYL